MYKIGIFIPYFGKWPDWIQLYFETLRKNSTIDFIFYTDCDTSIVDAPNIHFRKISFDNYVFLVNEKLDFKFKPKNAYKLCDLRPLFGYIHEDIFLGYDYYGWIDMDVLIGDIRFFYTEDILKKYDVFSTHEHRISGHFSIFKNTEKNRTMYKKIYHWKEALQSEPFIGIDEHGLTNAYLHTFFDKLNDKFNWSINNCFSKALSNKKMSKMYMVEQFSTPFLPNPWLDGTINSDQPDVWFYKDGAITNNRDGERKFMYLHFMNFKSSQWRHDNTKAPWEDLNQVCKANIDDMKTGIIIDKNGISPLSS